MQSAVTPKEMPAAAAPARSSFFPASARAVALNYCSAASLLLLGYLFYSSIPWYQAFFGPDAFAAMRVAIVGYLLVLPLYYATYPDSYTVKCRLFWRAMVRLPEFWPTPQERVAIRAVLVKAFYLPLMIKWLLYHAGTLAEEVHALGSGEDWLHEHYQLAFTFLFLVDILVYMVGYGVEHPRLGNEIRSVEPTLIGWAVTVGCYPPFVLFTGVALGSLGLYTSDYPVFGNPVGQVAAAVLMLLLVGVYVWASVALGFKASNLTYRGLVEAGPYRWVRHPAYAAKNLFWALGALPWLLAHWDEPLAVGCCLASMAAWGFVYYLRARTEEDHLGQDPAYKDYCRRVPYRFIPWVW